MALHSVAHALHSAAHFTQWSSLNIAHSAAHFSHMVAQSLHKSFANWASEDMKHDACLHIDAHSIKIPMQVFLACTSGSFKHSTIHSSHACAHLLQASIHFWYLSVRFAITPTISCPFYCYLNCLNT